MTLLSRVSAEAPGIGRADVDLGRRDVGILRDGKREDRADAHQHDDDRDDPGEDRPIDEDPRHRPSRRASACIAFIAPGGGALTRCGAVAGTGLIWAPSFRLAVPCVMTFSPAARPCGDDPVGPLRAVGDDRPLDRAIARTDDEQCGIALRIAGDRLLRHEERRRIDRLRESRGHEHARQQQRLRDWRSAREA